MPAQPTPRPQPEKQWKTVLYASLVAQMLSMIGFSASIPFVPLFLLKDLHVGGVAEAGLWSGAMVASSSLTMGILAPVWGTLADRYGRKSMLLRAMVSGCVVVGLMAICPNVWVLLILRIFQGALTGTVAANVALIASVTPKEKMGYSLGLVQTSVFAGASIGPLVGGTLADLTDFRMTFLITAVMLALATVIVVFFVHENFTPVVVDRQAPRLSRSQRFKEVFARKEFLGLVLILSLVQFSTNIIVPVLALFIQVLNRSTEGVASLAGLELGITGVASACSAALAGRLSDKYGHRRILICCTVLAALLYLPQALVTNVWQLLVLRGLMGLCFGGIVPSANAMIAELIPEGNKGTAFGLVSSFTSLGMASGPLAGAFIAALLSTRAVFLTTGVILLAAALWIRAILPARSRLAVAGPVLERDETAPAQTMRR